MPTVSTLAIELMRVLITGMTGFVGGHLTELLLREGGHTLAGYCRTARWSADLVHLQNHCRLYDGDLAECSKLHEALSEFQPDWIFHLAGYANPGESRKEPIECWASNYAGTRSLYETVLSLGVKPRILFASSGLVYGPFESHVQTIDETTSIHADTPYTASKIDAEEFYHHPRYQGLNIIRVRLFNQIGPRQTGRYFTPDVAREIVAVERGQRKQIEPRNLTAYRDFTDVRDMVCALRVVMEKGIPGEVYNVCSGEVRPLYDVFVRMIRLARTTIGIPETPPETSQPSFRASSDRLKSLGWQPKIAIDQTLEDILNYWRQREDTP